MSHNIYAADLQTSSFDLYYRVNSNSSYVWRNNITYGSNSPTVIDAGGGITRYQFNTPSIQAGGNYATIHFETNIVASPYALVNNFNPWVNLAEQNILTCSATGIAVVSKNLSYATTYWVDQSNESNNTLTFYGDVVLSGFNPGSNYTFVCSIGSSSYSFIDYNGAAVWFEQNPMSIVWSNDESIALIQTQIEQQNTIINQNQTIIDTQNQNTQDIIDNQNQNTEDIIRSNQNCQQSDNLFDGQLELGIYNGNTGEPMANSNFIRSSNFIPVEALTTYTFSSPDYNSGWYIYEYTSNYSYNLTANVYSANGSFQTKLGTSYVKFRTSNFTNTNARIMLVKGSTPHSYQPYGEEICKNINEQYYDEQRQADQNISNQSASDIQGTENQTTTSLIGALGSLVGALTNIQPASDCEIQLNFPSYAGGTLFVNPCQHKDKFPDIVLIGSSVFLVLFALKYWNAMAIKIYKVIRSFIDGTDDTEGEE